MDAFIGEIRPFAFNYVPQGWLACDGNQYQMSNYQALASVIGLMYGGSGNNFNVPDLRGRIGIGMGQLAGGNNYVEGQKGGVESITLNQNQLPNHDHNISGAFSTAAQQIAVEVAAPTNTTYLSNIHF